MTEYQALSDLITKWHFEKEWAESFLCEQFNLSKAEEILNQNNRGRKPIGTSGWYYCTHGIGVDIYKQGNSGGIDFDFGTDKLDSYKLRGFMIKQLNAGKLTKKYYRNLLQDSTLWETTFSLVRTET
jgi:hypothetical protein